MLKIGKIINEPTSLAEAGSPIVEYYVISENLDLNLYNDITSNEAWMTIGISFYDYLFCRKQVMYRTAAIGFANLSLEEKKYASEHFAVSKADRDTVHTEEEQLNNWEVFVQTSQRVRLERWVKAKGYISYHLNPVDSTDMALSTETLSKNFIEYGIESLAIDGVTGIYDWLENDYLNKSYYNETYKNNILLILQTGFY